MLPSQASVIGVVLGLLMAHSNVAAQPVVVAADTSITTDLAAIDEQDLYLLSLSEDTDVTVTLSTEDHQLDLKIALYRGASDADLTDGNFVLDFDVSGAGGSEITSLPLGSGSYLIAVSGLVSTGTYTVQVETGTVEVLPLEPGVTLDNELTTGDHDLFEVSLTAESTITLTLSGLFDGVILLYIESSVAVAFDISKIHSAKDEEGSGEEMIVTTFVCG